MAEQEKPTLTYEETPIMEPVPGSTPVNQPSQPQAPQPLQPSTPPPPPPPVPPPQQGKNPRGGLFRFLGTLVFFVILFALGVWLSTQLRSFMSPPPVPVATETPTPLPTLLPTETQPASPSGVPSSWKTYQVLSGATKKPIDGFSYMLPPDVVAPVCDGASCASQGTSLPGGTRLTVAARGKGQLLPDFRGAILTDAAGREFTMKQTIIGGLPVYEYTGNFTGRTGGGYTFTQMRGVLIAVTTTLAIDFNHFSPTGVTTDFAADDKLLDQMIGTIKVTTQLPLPTGTQKGATSSVGF